MTCSRAVLSSLFVPVLCLAAAPFARAENTGQLQDQLKKSADLSSPTAAGLKPWHAKLSVQLYDLKGVPPAQVPSTNGGWHPATRSAPSPFPTTRAPRSSPPTVFSAPPA